MANKGIRESRNQRQRLIPMPIVPDAIPTMCSVGGLKYSQPSWFDEAGFIKVDLHQRQHPRTLCREVVKILESI